MKTPLNNSSSCQIQPIMEWKNGRIEPFKPCWPSNECKRVEQVFKADHPAPHPDVVFKTYVTGGLRPDDKFSPQVEAVVYDVVSKTIRDASLKPLDEYKAMYQKQRTHRLDTTQKSLSPLLKKIYDHRQIHTADKGVLESLYQQLKQQLIQQYAFSPKKSQALVKYHQSVNSLSHTLGNERTPSPLQKANATLLQAVIKHVHGKVLTDNQLINLIDKAKRNAQLLRQQSPLPINTGTLPELSWLLNQNFWRGKPVTIKPSLARLGEPAKQGTRPSQHLLSALKHADLAYTKRFIEPINHNTRVNGCYHGADLIHSALQQRGITSNRFFSDTVERRFFDNNLGDPQNLGHFANLVKDRTGQIFLCDLTFSQFVRANGQIQPSAPDKDNVIQGGPPANARHPVLKQLLKHGYVALSPDNRELAVYFQALSTNRNPDHLKSIKSRLAQVSPNAIFNTQSLDDDYFANTHLDETPDALDAVQTDLAK